MKDDGRGPRGRHRRTIERDLRAKLAIEDARETGVLPLDVMLLRMRGEPLPDGKMVTEEMFQAAQAAAPYIHPRLASTDTTVKSDNVHRVVSSEPLTIEEWAAKHGAVTGDAVAALEDGSSEEETCH